MFCAAALSDWLTDSIKLAIDWAGDEAITNVLAAVMESVIAELTLLVMTASLHEIDINLIDVE